jgi:hypothetical protein
MSVEEAVTTVIRKARILGQSLGEGRTSIAISVETKGTYSRTVQTEKRTRTMRMKVPKNLQT